MRLLILLSCFLFMGATVSKVPLYLMSGDGDVGKMQVTLINQPGVVACFAKLPLVRGGEMKCCAEDGKASVRVGVERLNQVSVLKLRCGKIKYIRDGVEA